MVNGERSHFSVYFLFICFVFGDSTMFLHELEARRSQKEELALLFCQKVSSAKKVKFSPVLLEKKSSGFKVEVSLIYD